MLRHNEREHWLFKMKSMLYFKKKLECELLWLTCRHYIMELALEKTFILCFGSSSTPDIPIFKSFKAVWNGVARANFRALELNGEIKAFTEPAITFLKHYIWEQLNFISEMITKNLLN